MTNGIPTSDDVQNDDIEVIEDQYRAGKRQLLIKTPDGTEIAIEGDFRCFQTDGF